ncbi:Abhydrolase_3 domain-containing protein [Cephalotus follicularis]|uniref:Abhydrolase_3 domain-containing protein n=1 Tax=Cephalotus follicularis TaxID=3775 RepID=A0A1Q3DA35_CEPFO|nr:Abhydrolase_3 domain-containing protein [Cephalotus follicularis]
MSLATPTISKPSLSWKTKIAMSIITAVTDASSRTDGTVNRRLSDFLDPRCPPNPNPINSVSSSDVTVDPLRKLWFRFYTPCPATEPPSSAALPVVIFFHGGGFAFLSAASKAYDAVCRRLSRILPAYVVSVNYRRTPEFRYPSQYEDGFDVLKFLDADEDDNGPFSLPQNADLSKCFLAGDSAGANLAHHMAVRAAQAGFRTLKVIGLISIQPFFGGEERTESETRLVGAWLVSLSRTDWAWKVFLPEGSDRDHAAANVSGPNAVDISKLDYPDTVVLVGGLDPLKDRQRRYYQWLKKSGKEAELIEYPNMIHAFYIFPEIPESRQVFSQIKQFVTKTLSKSKL